MTETETDRPMAPIEHRYAGVKVEGLNFPQRLVTVIAVPYDEPALVEYRQEMWNEIFERTAFLGLEKRPNRIRVNRDHDKTRPIGKAMRFWPTREEGLVAELRIAETLLGDETLQLAKEDCLSLSVGFGVLPKDQALERRTMTRRIKTAYLDHISFVESPAYAGANVLSVRDDGRPDTGSPILTPHLDEFTNSDAWRWASERLK